MKIIVDADACPRGALASAASLAERYGARLVTVAGFDHVIDSPEHVTVGDGPQEADIKIINLTRAGDAVVTQDIGLAAAVLGKKRRRFTRAASNTARKPSPRRSKNAK